LLILLLILVSSPDTSHTHAIARLIRDIKAPIPDFVKYAIARLIRDIACGFLQQK